MLEHLVRSCGKLALNDDHIDFMGENNVVLYVDPEQSKPTYLLIDPLVPAEKGVLHEARRAFLRGIVGERLSRQEKVVLINTMGYVRTVNGLAAALGTDWSAEDFSGQHASRTMAPTTRAAPNRTV